MSGGEIGCGSFLAEDKSGSAFEGVLSDISHLSPQLVKNIRAGLENAEYVLIPMQQTELLLPLLQNYRHQLVSQIGHDDWWREAQAEVAAGMNPVRGKWGKSRGWRLYCVTNLILACEASMAQHESIHLVFSWL